MKIKTWKFGLLLVLASLFVSNAQADCIDLLLELGECQTQPEPCTNGDLQAILIDMLNEICIINFFF